ncbi:MAG: PilZ domain-containing protein [Proteobacteria bacterium]|nr:PilZ domain-containing protein [Pseudomonadota bacterium]MBU4297628.1 PilZ domain-containing protein [Pseudomonadota bacterium]MCG2750009.1 PilZ domain-containing protein [Desulfobulbaceae bacterium]
MKRLAIEGEEGFVGTRERRENKRYRIKSGIAALMLENSSKIATIIDISSTGLSFVIRQCEMRENSLLEMDILLLDDIRKPDNDIFFPNIKCTVVSTDSFIDHVTPYALQTMTRCSVRFDAAIPLDSCPVHRVAGKKAAEFQVKRANG